MKHIKILHNLAETKIEVENIKLVKTRIFIPRGKLLFGHYVDCLAYIYTTASSSPKHTGRDVITHTKFSANILKNPWWFIPTTQRDYYYSLPQKNAKEL